MELSGVTCNFVLYIAIFLQATEIRLFWNFLSVLCSTSFLENFQPQGVLDLKVFCGCGVLLESLKSAWSFCVQCEYSLNPG